MLTQLEKFGAAPVSERVVVDGAVMTAAGVSAGIDMALQLATHLAGATVAHGVQIAIEYDPQPPFCGSPAVAPPAVLDAALRALTAGG
jgi:cyclohexyl-isocyanide hydratase